MNYKPIILDGVKWIFESGRVQPLCPKHHLRLSLAYNDNHASSLSCAECKERYKFPREYTKQEQYVLDKLDARQFKDMKFINLDDEAIPIAKDKVISENGKYFVTSLLTKSKVGHRLVVYAGEREKKEKTQIFVEPEIKRVAFDQKDLHPAEVFVKLKATFDDGSSASISKKKTKT